MELTLLSLYQKMHRKMGPSGWWPADSKEEIIIGALMIQNTNWQNADKSVANFQQKTGFDPEKITNLPMTEIQRLVRPAGFYKNKSKAVAAVFSWLAQFNFDYSRIHQSLGTNLRGTLLKLHGVGDETADVLRTYIFDDPTFIADKYARTLFTRLGVPNLSNYQSLAKQCSLGPDFTVAMAQDFHGLIDEFGKQYFHPATKFDQSFLCGDRLIL